MTVEDNLLHKGKLNSNLFLTNWKENSTGKHFCPGPLNYNSALNPVSQYSLENKILCFCWTEDYQVSRALGLIISLKSHYQLITHPHQGLVTKGLSLSPYLQVLMTITLFLVNNKLLCSFMSETTPPPFFFFF